MPHDLHLNLLRLPRPLSNLTGQLRRNVREAGAQFAVEGEVGLFGEVGGLEVVGAGDGVDFGDGEGVVGGELSALGVEVGSVTSVSSWAGREVDGSIAGSSETVILESTVLLDGVGVSVTVI